jgi:hypothetical protein
MALIALDRIFAKFRDAILTKIAFALFALSVRPDARLRPRRSLLVVNQKQGGHFLSRNFAIDITTVQVLGERRHDKAFKPNAATRIIDGGLAARAH